MEMLAGKRVFITGATGFLGGVLARRLIKEGAHIRALVRRANRDQYIRDLPGIELVNGDISDTGRMKEVIQGCDIVFHSAAALSGDLETQRKVNVEGTRNISQAAVDAGVTRFVHISTISVYGYRNTQDVTEQTPMNPGLDAYPITKAEAEIALQRIAHQTGLPYTIIRPGMIYGPHSSMWTRKMFSIARRKPTVWIGNGSGSAYAIYVEDVADLAICAAIHPAAIGEIFNATPDPSPTWHEFLGGYAALAGHDRWFGIPSVLLRPVALSAKMFSAQNSTLKDLPDMLPFSQRYITYKMDKAQQLLGWQPKVSVEEGIQRCVPYLREKGLMQNSI